MCCVLTVLLIYNIRFILAMANKFVAIINSTKNYEHFTIWNEISCTKLQLPPEHLTRGLPSLNPRSLCPLSSTEFVEPPPTPNKPPWYATGRIATLTSGPTRLGVAYPPFLVKQLYHCASVVISSFARTGYTTRRWGWLLGRIGYSITHFF